MTWRDIVATGALVPQQFQKPCGFGGSDMCVDAPIAEGGPVLIEVDRTTRFVAQSLGSRRLYVIATSLGTDHEPVLDQAFDVAASIITTDRTEDATRRSLSTLGTRADTLTAGEWFVDLGDVVVEMNLAEDLEGIAILDTGTTWFALQATDEQVELPPIFSVQVFQGFVDGALQGDDADADLPLPADVYLRGVATVASVEAEGSSTIAGHPSRWYEVGDPAPDSPFACTPPQRRDLGADDLCVTFSVDGWRFIGGADRTDYRAHYVEELGVVVSYALAANGDGAMADPRFQPILDALVLSEQSAE